MTGDTSRFDPMILYCENRHPQAPDTSAFSRQVGEQVLRLHRMHSAYAVTPLVSLSALARQRHVGHILVKDESFRFGLKAFKGLGGLYAMFRMICDALSLDPAKTTLESLQREPFASRIRDMVFVTTTDGNHGKGVSWAAGVFGCQAHVFMPAGTVEVRAQAIRDAGNADVQITDMPYDACVQHTRALAAENGWYLIQDTAWTGYETVPLYIMQGYLTILEETEQQLRVMGVPAPTHVFLQCGVGSMAGAIAAGCRERFAVQPRFFLAEPVEVACFYESFLRADGHMHTATGNGRTQMAGLNCATPCTLAWDILGKCATGAFACDDSVMETGMRRLGVPCPGDARIVSGESGAVTLGLLECLLTESRWESWREKVQLNEKSVILLISTEGNTDPAHYHTVMAHTVKDA